MVLYKVFFRTLSVFQFHIFCHTCVADVLLDKTALVWGVPTARVELVSGSTLPSERVTGVISIEQVGR